jgi:hypothetical protein
MMTDVGVRLRLLAGPTVPTPVDYEVVDALESVEVTNRDRERDGFQLTFRVGKDSPVDYALVRGGLLDPPARVSLIVLFTGGPHVLINGIVTDHQLVPSNRPSASTLHVTGDDVGLELDFVERNAVFRNQSDADIVRSIISNYSLKPDVTDTTDVPTEQQRVTPQHSTDLEFVQGLAENNGFVFFVEPSAIPGVGTAYWGPERRTGPRQRVLTVGTGPDATVDDTISFDYDALVPTTPQILILDPNSGQQRVVGIPPAILAELSKRPAAPLRTKIARTAAKYDMSQGTLHAAATSTQSSDAVTGRGELDAVRYGRALRSRQLVDVRGAGASHDGTYYVKEVSHRLRRGSYRQSFVLTRDGRGALSSSVAT